MTKLSPRDPRLRRLFKPHFWLILSTTVLLSARIKRAPPIYLQDPDPTYAYLLNIGNVAQLSPVGHLDHPGIGYDIILAPFAFIRSAINGHFLNIREDITSNPESYITYLLYCQLAMICGAVLIFIWTASNALKGWQSLLLSLAVSSLLLRFTTTLKLTPENLVFAVGFIVAAYALAADKTRLKTSLAVSLAFLAIWGKVVAIPLLPLLVFAIPRRHLWSAMATCVSVSLGALYFAREGFDYMFNWFSALLTSSGRYETDGASYSANLTKGFSNFKSILQLTNIEIGILAISLLVAGFIATRRRKVAGFGPSLPAVVSLVAAFGLTLMIGVKDSVVRDFAVAPSLFASALMIFATTADRIGRPLDQRRARILGISLFVPLYLTVGLTALALTNDLYARSYPRDGLAFRQEREEVAVSDGTVLYSYRARDPYAALLWANGYAGGRYSEALVTFGTTTRGEPSSYFNIWNNRVFFYNSETRQHSYRAVSNMLEEKQRITIIGARPGGFQSTPYGYAFESGGWLPVTQVLRNAQKIERGWTIGLGTVHPIAYTE